MDYDNSDTLFNHYSIPRGLGISLQGHTSMNPFFGGDLAPSKIKGDNITKKNHMTKKNIKRNGRHSRKQYTK
jgi:hypothetical protein